MSPAQVGGLLGRPPDRYDGEPARGREAPPLDTSRAFFLTNVVLSQPKPPTARRRGARGTIEVTFDRAGWGVVRADYLPHAPEPEPQLARLRRRMGV